MSRVVLVGHGAGAHMAAAFACARPDTVRGLVMVAGVYRPAECQVRTGLSVLSVLGDADPILPLAGGTTPEFAALFAGAPHPGSEYDVPPAADALDEWAEGLGCERTAKQNLGVVTMQIDTGCRGDGEVWKVVIPGAGHEWYPATYDLVVQFLRTGPLATS